MGFSIITEASERPDPYEMGEIQLIDPASGKTSTPIPYRRRYMVFIEIVTVFDFLVTATTNNKASAYVISDGSKVTYIPKERAAIFEFPDLTVKQGVKSALDDLRATLYTVIEMLSHVDNQDDSVLVDLRSSIVSGDYL